MNRIKVRVIISLTIGKEKRNLGGVKQQGDLLCWGTVRRVRVKN
jgi:hypothetical protein